MPYLDTHRQDHELVGVDPHEFDEIELMSRRGHYYGASVWHKVKLLKARFRGDVIEPETRKRLLVLVDEENDPETAKRVRVALGLPEDQQFGS